MTFNLELEKNVVNVRGYKKKFAGTPHPDNFNARNPEAYAKWYFGGAKTGELPVGSHERTAPAPTERELVQKRANNSLAAKGSKKRVWVSPKGKVKVVSKEKKDTLMRNERKSGKR